MNYKKFVPCEKCKDARIPGFPNRLNEPGIIECPCHRQWRKDQDTFIKYKAGTFPLNNFDYDISSYKGETSKENVERLNKLVTNIARAEGVWVYLSGPNSTQKTTVASWFGKKCIEAGFSARYILMSRLLSLLQNQEFNEDDRLLLEKYRQADVLVMDESFDREKITIYKSNYQIPFLDTLLRERTFEGKVTMFISNVAMQDIDLSESIRKLVMRETAKHKADLRMLDNIETELEGWTTEEDLF